MYPFKIEPENNRWKKNGKAREGLGGDLKDCGWRLISQGKPDKAQKDDEESSAGAGPAATLATSLATSLTASLVTAPAVSLTASLVVSLAVSPVVSLAASLAAFLAFSLLKYRNNVPGEN
jgi:hypothetical protein